MARIKGIDENKEVVNVILPELENIGVSRMIETLNLKKSIFKQTSLKGHFGHKDFNWEVC